MSMKYYILDFVAPRHAEMKQMEINERLMQFLEKLKERGVHRM